MSNAQDATRAGLVAPSAQGENDGDGVPPVLTPPVGDTVEPGKPKKGRMVRARFLVTMSGTEAYYKADHAYTISERELKSLKAAGFAVEDEDGEEGDGEGSKSKGRKGRK